MTFQDQSHSYLNEVHFGECLVVSGLLNVENGNDVLMVEVSKELHLSQGSQTKHGVIEGSDLFDGHFLT